MDLLADYEESPLNAKEGLDYIYACYKDAIEREDGHGCLTINVLTSFGQGRLEIGIGSNQFYDKNLPGKQEEQKRPQKAKPKRRKMESDSEGEPEDDSSDIM